MFLCVVSFCETLRYIEHIMDMFIYVHCFNLKIFKIFELCKPNTHTKKTEWKMQFCQNCEISAGRTSKYDYNCFAMLLPSG